MRRRAAADPWLLVFGGLLCLMAVAVIVAACVNRHDTDTAEDAVSVTETNAATEAEPALSVTDEERELLAKLVWNEAGLCSDECQRAIVSVVFNQLEAGYWGTKLEAVVTSGNFVGGLPEYLEAAEPNQRCYDSVDYVLRNGCTVEPSVRYFRAGHGWEQHWPAYETVLVLDNVYFGEFTSPEYH